MSLSTQEAILIAINERAKELAAMYAITKEQQQVLDVLAGRVLNEVDRIEKTMREFDGVATSKFALAIEKGLTNVGAKIADGALKESLKVSHNCSIEIKKSTDKVSGVVAEASKYFNALTIRFFLMMSGVISALVLVIFVLHSTVIAIQNKKIVSNNEELREQDRALKVLIGRGVKLQKNENGTWLIAREGLTLDKCGGVQCVRIP